MVFVARFSGKDLVVPVRTYLHDVGLEKWDINGDGVQSAANYHSLVFKSDGIHRIVRDEKLDYVIAALWNNEGNKTADVFGYSGVKNNWKANPEVRAWNCINGIWRDDAHFCGDMVMILGAEETWRRASTKDLKYYMSHPPINLPPRAWKPINGE
ncbi:hypothetical protein HY212_07625 [Candidatus Pacearchaeota archaeon]|nr:hypothetical protein [Candidatus Pacearchaeota archaeon]